MTETVDRTPPDSLVHALTVRGALEFDPIGLHYIETLSRRASAHEGRVRQLLDGKILAAATALDRRLDSAQTQAQPVVAKENAVPVRETLGQLVLSMAQDRIYPTAPFAHGHLAPRAELKSVKNFRNTWSKLSVDKQVTQALAKAPKNAGPLNSHLVALRSLALMRDISPDYLNRFISYMDTLLRLDQGALARATLPGRVTPADSGSAKKTKAARVQAG
jgi:hypothetical protein